MDTSHFLSIALLTLQAVLAMVLVLGLARLRGRLGPLPLYVAIGVLQPLQVVLSTVVYVEVFPGFAVSPGSAVFFTATLTAVLLVYVLEDALEARKLIYGLVAANAVVFAVLRLTATQLSGTPAATGLAGAFEVGARVMLVGTGLLYLDSVLLILVFEALARRVRSLFLRTYLTLASVLALDSVLFVVGAFGLSGDPSALIASALLGKLSFALLFAAAAAAYLRHGPRVRGEQHEFRDVFAALTYRERFAEATRRGAERLAESEQHRRAILEATTDLILVLDEQHRIVELNRAAEEAFGPLPLSLEDVLVDEDSRALLLSSLERDPDRPCPQAVELSCVRAPGDVFPAELTVSTTRRDERPLFVVNLRDISVRKQLTEEFLQTKKMESIGMLAGGIAHDFNNLLTVIRGNAELLADEPLADGARSHVSAIEDVADRAGDLTRQLLMFARRAPIHATVLEVSAAVRAFEPMLRRVTGEEVDLVTQLADQPLPVRIDANMLEQVLLNLVGNATEALAGGGRIVLRTEAHERGHERFARLVVEDDGAGIPDDVREQLFDPFFTTKADQGGTGLGLATCFGVVTRFGGRIAVDNVPGGGARFEVLLPLSAEPVVHGALDGRPTGFDGGDETILLVEDSPPLLEVLEQSLASRGYRVLSAANGTEALSRWEQHGDQIDLLVTDVVMPFLNGRDLSARLRAMRPELLVLTISGHTRGLQVELDERSDFLEKPFRPSDLAAAVRALLDRRRRLSALPDRLAPPERRGGTRPAAPPPRAP